MVRKIHQLSFVENIRLGDHLIYFYGSPTEKYNVLFSNLKIAFEQDCAALYIASGATTEQAHKELHDFGFRPDHLKSLTIATSHQFYLPDGVFHADRVVRQIRNLIDERVNQGFKGLYVSSDVADTFEALSQDLTEWMHFIHSWGKTLPLPMAAIYAYRINSILSNSEALLQLIQAYSSTITTKTQQLIDNNKLYMDAVTEELHDILGEEATETIFRYMETTLQITRNQIPDTMDTFNKILEQILGNAAAPIQQHIIQNVQRTIEL